MTKECYLIADVAKKVQVETHVLRYWEEELDLKIQRNEMGRRIYTQEDVERFVNICKWKEQGLQLKAIRTLLAEEKKQRTSSGKSQTASNKSTTGSARSSASSAEILVKLPANKLISEPSKEEKAARLQILLREFISQAVRENNEELVETLRETMVKELDFQFRQQEEAAEERELRRLEREEEHYKKLDQLLSEKRRKKEQSGTLKAVFLSGDKKKKHSVK